jgi:hypothetical protein
MAAGIVNQIMPISITIKNTFLTLEAPEEKPVRRSSSVPRTFKLGDSNYIETLHSDASTDASEKDNTENTPTNYSDADSQDGHTLGCLDAWEDCLSEVPADASVTSDEYQANKVTLSLADMVSGDTGKVRCKLSSCAQPFRSARTPPAEVQSVIAMAVEVMSSGTDIVDVTVHDGGMGRTTMIVGKSSSTDPDGLWLFSLVKDALLTAAERSENTYILGYGNQPFNNLDPLSFSANIVHVPAAHKDTACWDTYEQGHCPRCSTCRWDHPGEMDTMRVIVMISANGPSF